MLRPGDRGRFVEGLVGGVGWSTTAGAIVMCGSLVVGVVTVVMGQKSLRLGVLRIVIGRRKRGLQIL